MSEVDDIKRGHFEALRNRDVIVIAKSSYGWEVDQWLPDGVCPPCVYDTPHEAAARVCQLLKIKGPVIPQDWPEVAQIGGDGRDKPPRHRTG